MMGLFDVWMRCGLAAVNAMTSCAPSPCGCISGCGCGSDDVIVIQSGGRGAGTSTQPTGNATLAVQRVVTSNTFTLRQKAAVPRRLKFDQRLTNGYLVIPNDRVTLKPDAGRDPQLGALGQLRAGETTFRIEVDATGLPGNVYSGIVGAQTSDGSTVESVRVEIEL
jgi:hypothetical protein